MLTREVTVHPGKTTLPFPNGSGSDHDEFKAHLFEFLYTIQSVWDWQGIVNPGRLVIFLHLALEGRASQCEAGKGSGKIVQQSLWVNPSRGSVKSSASAIWTKEFTYAPVIVI